MELLIYDMIFFSWSASKYIQIIRQSLRPIRCFFKGISKIFVCRRLRETMIVNRESSNQSAVSEHKTWIVKGQNWKENELEISSLGVKLTSRHLMKREKEEKRRLQYFSSPCSDTNK
jgi:hypothetical protein